MTTLTIPRQLTKGDELIVIPRREYEEFSEWRETIGQIKEFTPAPSLTRELKRARAEYRQGKFLTLHEFKQRMAVARSRKRN